MPIYEYQCEKCGEFEEMQRITDPALERCPRCRRKVRRLMSATSFHLKGSGWYVTDYARAGTANGAKKESGAASEAKAESKAENKSESKSANKSESKSESKSAESKPASAASSEKPSS